MKGFRRQDPLLPKAEISADEIQVGLSSAFWA